MSLNESANQDERNLKKKKYAQLKVVISINSVLNEKVLSENLLSNSVFYFEQKPSKNHSASTLLSFGSRLCIKMKF